MLWWIARPAGPACARRDHFFAEGIQNRLFIRGIFIGGDQVEHPIFGSPLDLLDQCFNMFGRAFARYYSQHQPMDRVQCDVIPAVTQPIVSRVVIVAMLLFLADERPLLVHLYFVGTRGKWPPVRRATPSYDHRPSAPTA